MHIRAKLEIEKAVKKIILALGLSFSILLLAGCASDDNKLPYEGDSAQFIYAKGHSFLKEGDYPSAISAYKSLNAQYPFEHFSQLGTLDLIYAYYQKADSAMMIAAATQFIKLHPQNKNIGYAYYMLGIAHFDNGRGFLQRRLPYEMAQHDPVGYKKAFFEFKRAIALSPKASYVSDAKRRMVYLNNTIGRYELNIAQYNFEHKAYVGAINRAKKVVQQYSRSEAVESALVVMAKSYNILGLPKMAEASVAVLKKNFPDNKYLESVISEGHRESVIVN